MLINMHYAQINHAGEQVGRLQEVICPPILHAVRIIENAYFYPLSLREAGIWQNATSRITDIYTEVDITLC